MQKVRSLAAFEKSVIAMARQKIQTFSFAMFAAIFSKSPPPKKYRNLILLPLNVIDEGRAFSMFNVPYK